MIPPLRNIDKYTWMIDSDYKECMQVPVIIFADDYLLRKMEEDLTLVQAVNVSCL
ncbi:MAG: RNA-splicing ligase RtcB, partial [Thermoprotei archaeon]